jgi:prefoldin subunit 5
MSLKKELDALTMDHRRLQREHKELKSDIELLQDENTKINR